MTTLVQRGLAELFRHVDDPTRATLAESLYEVRYAIYNLG